MRVIVRSRKIAGVDGRTCVAEFNLLPLHLKLDNGLIQRSPTKIDSHCERDLYTYHFTYTSQSSADTTLSRVQGPTILHTVRSRNNNGVSYNHASSIPARGHGPTERVKQILRFLGHALSTALLAFLQARDGSGFPALQGANIQGVYRWIGVHKRG